MPQTHNGNRSWRDVVASSWDYGACGCKGNWYTRSACRWCNMGRNKGKTPGSKQCAANDKEIRDLRKQLAAKQSEVESGMAVDTPPPNDDGKEELAKLAKAHQSALAELGAEDEVTKALFARVHKVRESMAISKPSVALRALEQKKDRKLKAAERADAAVAEAEPRNEAHAAAQTAADELNALRIRIGVQGPAATAPSAPFEVPEAFRQANPAAYAQLEALRRTVAEFVVSKAAPTTPSPAQAQPGSPPPSEHSPAESSNFSAEEFEAAMEEEDMARFFEDLSKAQGADQKRKLAAWAATMATYHAAKKTKRL